VAGGIVNPLGPTLGALVLPGAKGGGDWTLYRLSLNPFLQELTRLRAAKAEEVATPSRVIEEQRLGLNSTPTLLFFGPANSEEIYACARQLALASNDLATVVDRLRRFPGNPWDRISEEMDETNKQFLAGVPTRAIARRLGAAKSKSLSISDSKSNRKTTDQNIKDYISLIFDKKNLKEEISAFKTAWTGSVDFQASGNSGLAKTAMPFSDVNEAISILLRSADEKRQ
jgi:hypothetical protein